MNIHGSGLDSVYCSMVFLGNVNLPLTVMVLITGSQSSVCICSAVSHSSQLSSASLGRKHCRDSSYIRFLSSPLLGFGRRREKPLGVFSFSKPVINFVTADWG